MNKHEIITWYFACLLNNRYIIHSIVALTGEKSRILSSVAAKLNMKSYSCPTSLREVEFSRRYITLLSYYSYIRSKIVYYYAVSMIVFTTKNIHFWYIENYCLHVIRFQFIYKITFNTTILFRNGIFYNISIIEKGHTTVKHFNKTELVSTACF